MPGGRKEASTCLDIYPSLLSLYSRIWVDSHDKAVKPAVERRREMVGNGNGSVEGETVLTPS